MPILQTGLTKSAAEDYTIDQSLRFNQTDSYLSRTVGTATSNRIGTFSFWTKMGTPLGDLYFLNWASTFWAGVIDFTKYF